GKPQSGNRGARRRGRDHADGNGHRAVPQLRARRGFSRRGYLGRDRSRLEPRHSRGWHARRKAMKRARWTAILMFASMAAAQQNPPCSCGANPPGLPRDREVRPYAGTPPEMRPFGKFTEPYSEIYTKTVEYNGGARD